uniref:Uncharacterized protein TCIL3000_10_10860 n=1 Tax=Trypanosoma congolense (strain IL3000) TaxID=1068625 RepID=G0UY40_TRYCI|nr:unnamed protein product [Trypanosoma congolense IL3000]
MKGTVYGADVPKVHKYSHRYHLAFMRSHATVMRACPAPRKQQDKKNGATPTYINGMAFPDKRLRFFTRCKSVLTITHTPGRPTSSSADHIHHSSERNATPRTRANQRLKCYGHTLLGRQYSSLFDSLVTPHTATQRTATEARSAQVGRMKPNFHSALSGRRPNKVPYRSK